MSNQENTPVARRLKEARTAAGLSQKSLGIEAGIDQFSASARMNQYETGKHVPDYGTVERIANILDLPAAYFYCAEDNLAQLIELFHRSTNEKREEVLSLLDVNSQI